MRQYKFKLNNSLTYNVKDVDTTGRRIVLYAAAFDNIDRDGDVIVKGAFTKTIKEQGPEGIGEIWHLLYHDPAKPVSTPTSMEQDNYGLLSVVPMPKNTVGNDTLQMYLDGHYKHHSIGYSVIQAKAKSNYNELQEVALREHSTVLWAANPAAITVDIKSIIKEMTTTDIEKEIDLTIKSYRNGKYSDDTFALLDIKLKQLIAASANSVDTLAGPITDAPGPLENGVDPNYARMKFSLLTNGLLK